MLKESYAVLERLRHPEHVFYASSSDDYRYVWIRDTVYMSLPYANKPDSRYEQTYHRLFDLFLSYEWKLDQLCTRRPEHVWEYIHARYSAELKEIHNQEWGHAQHDMIGAFLYGTGLGLRQGKRMLRDPRDIDIVRKLVAYLERLEYWHDPDNGMWEEGREVHASSVGACVAGLKAVQPYVNVPEALIERGLRTLLTLFPRESESKPCDLALLSLVYPYRLFTGFLGGKIVANVRDRLLRARGVIRYEGDSYYSTLERAYGRSQPAGFYLGSEAEWTFGLPWLALCCRELGQDDDAKRFLAMTESVMLEPGVWPELYYAGTSVPNPNTPLGWSTAMYILAKEAIAPPLEQRHTAQRAKATP
ncbi:MAG: glycoside hydrolase family 15 [Paenibacillaceae bacterium]|nr:glycoside hydrolase family 15 [Paenibacillaceae bacterium]